MAQRIPKDFINLLISRANIVDIIGSHLNLQKKGNDYWACCPFHNEKTASFSVSESKQFYYCFGCGAKGNVIDFLMEFLNLSYPCLLYTSPSPRDRTRSRMPSSA